MQININSVHFKADRQLEDFICEKIQKVVKFHDGIISGDVTLKLENTDKPENKIVEVRLKVKGHDLISSKQCKTFEEATDLAIDALKNRVKKMKKSKNRTNGIDFTKIEEDIEEKIEQDIDIEEDIE